MIDLDALVYSEHPAVTDGTATLAHTGYDVEAWHGALASGPARLAGLVRSAAGELTSAPALLRDLYFALYQPAPVPSTDALAPGYGLNRQVLRTLMDLEEYSALRAVPTVGDLFASALATIALADAALGALADADKAGANAAAERGRKVARAQELARAYADAATERADPAQAAAAAARAARYAALADKLGDAPDEPDLDADAEGELRGALRRAAAAVTVELTTLREQLAVYGSGWGSTGPGGAPAQVSGADAAALAARIASTPALARIAAIAGAKVRLALATQRRKTSYLPPQITGVTRGADLARMLGRERALFASDSTRILGVARFASRSLAQFKVEQRVRLGRGPIIVAMDESGSMYGESDMWAKAILLALAAIARHQQRAFAAIEFAHRGRFLTTAFPTRPAEHSAAALGVCERFLGGGTDYSDWMEESMRLVRTAALRSADVVLLTDGVCGVAPDQAARWSALRAETGLQVHSVLVGATDPYGTLGAISDDVTTLASFLDDDAATSTLFAI